MTVNHADDTARMYLQLEAQYNLFGRNSQGIIGRILDGMTARKELIPGGKEALAEQVRAKGGTLLEAVRTLGTLLEGDGKKYLDVERPAPATLESPLRGALRRFGFGEKVVSELHDRHAAELAGLDGPTLLVALTRTLHTPENIHLIGAPAVYTRPEPTAPPRPAAGHDLGSRHLRGINF